PRRGGRLMVTELTRTTDLAASATSLFVGEMAKAIAARGEFVVALSGGTTPLGLFANLARLPDLGWDRVKVFWGDERFVAHDDEASNFRSARATFLERLPVDPANVYPWPQPAGSGDLRSDLAGAAARYAEVLTSVLGDEPVFDLQLLGLGSDAQDRKSTRLNSSHVKISYAVFCLTKKLVRFKFR